MSKNLIFIVEDEEDIANLSSFHLSNQGYDVEIYIRGDAALEAIKSKKPDLVLLDIMLPGLDGLKICEVIKSDEATRKIPIIMVTAKGDESDIVKGLELGADDYITKPFSPQVMLARVKTVLRRQFIPPKSGEGEIKIHKIKINPLRREVSVDEQKVELTHSEFQLLHFLAQKPGWVFTRNQIVDAIRGANYAVTDRSIDVVVVGLRKKLGERGNVIDTVRGVGYRFLEET